MRGDSVRELVTTAEEIVANLATLHSMASGNLIERKFHAGRIKNGKVFVAAEMNGDLIFAPSRFCGYVRNDIHHLDPNVYRHGSETNIAIRRVLGKEIGPADKPYAELDASYLAYCARFGIKPSQHRMERRYWFAVANNNYSDEAGCSSCQVEGAVMTVKVNRYERSPEARRLCLAHHGTTCSVCDLNFADRYGEIGAGFIHVHHLVPLSDIGESYQVDPIKDLRPVCPNCHAMLHKGNQCLTIEALKRRLMPAASGVAN